MDNILYKWSKSGNAMIVNSDFKEFNKQTNLITSGNVIANTIYGRYIRPYNETKCNGITFEKGELFDFDLKLFHISNNFKEYIKSLERQVILYEIFIYRNGKRDIIGWLVEDNGKIICDLLKQTRGNYNKRYSALDIVRKIIEYKNCK